MTSFDRSLPCNGATLLLIRHGQTAYNAEGRAQGWIDVPLSPLGYRQADSLATGLADRHLDALYSSPLSRAYATALAVGKPHGLVPRRVEDLKEVHVGAMSGRTWDELAAVFPEAVAAYRAAEAGRPHPRHRELLPGWEPIPVFVARVWAALVTIAEAHPAETVAVVAHGGVINALLTQAATGAALESPWEYHHRNCAVSELLLGATGPELVSVDRLLHDLEAPGLVVW